MHEHYNKEYFDWQKNIGAFGGWANVTKFNKYITEDMNVIDFGCGGGFLLNNIKCKNKLGIEINDEARKHVNSIGIDSVKHIEEAPDNWADCIVSNHALEHVPNPLEIITKLKPKLKVGGKIIFVVPCDSVSYKYKPNDVNYHLFSWSPMNLGNLFTEAGYKVIESKALIHKWPPYYRQIAKLFGRTGFNLACKIYARIERSYFQSRVIAIREK